MEKILIIEHDRATQRALKLLFEPEGYIVQASSDGKAGLAAFRRSRPTLVILDLKLPRVPGQDLCREIKKELPSLPVLVLTAVADEAEKVLLLELGADDYVTSHSAPENFSHGCAPWFAGSMSNLPAATSPSTTSPSTSSQ